MRKKMPRPLISIGLEPNVVEAIKKEVGHIVVHDTLPRMYSHIGQAFVESPSIYGKYLRPRGVLYYCYFEEPGSVRRSLALSDTPTFPGVRRTIMHDDKALSLIAALDAEAKNGYPGIARGFTDEIPVPLDEGETAVAKWGYWHCGEDKKLCEGEAIAPEAAIIEPFIVGESHRVLVVGDSYWQLHYESEDWRKNVNSTITVLDVPDRDLALRAHKTAKELGLVVAGIDYIINDDGAFLLEVNAYPGLYQVQQAEEKFIELAVDWARNLED
jgi:hypothetical protein